MVYLVHKTFTESILKDLATNGDAKRQALYRTCQGKGATSFTLKVALPELASPSLLDRVQNRPDVDGTLRLLRKQRTKARGNNVYIPPQAKPSLNSLEDSQFPLMGKVNEFLESDHKVFLLLGDSGAGKSTFSRELEYDLWRSYKNKSDPIPLHINLPTIDKPEHDMIAKQLRRTEFTEPQIREMKHYRRFILICDGYDESQQTRNLYMSNELNQPGGWNAQMVITCRSEYLGDDYRHRFQPGDRDKQHDSLFQEAVITPFSLDQVHAYIHQYVSLHQPLWQSGDYKNALELIPSLKDLVKNPFLMALSLEVLPRMVDPGQQLSTARVTRVGLYDHFVEQWLERGKKRLGEKELSPQVKTVFERLSAEGFTANGIGFMKKLAVAMYKEQDGHPVVEYLQLVDEGSWKDDFFKDEHKHPLLESSPLIRNGNQHRFIHRSLLEYALARAVFDPQDRRNRSVPGPSSGRRGSASSTLSFEVFGEEKSVTTVAQEPDPNSPLMWRSFVNDHSLLQFLQERVQQEPVFKDQLLDYIEYSKKDKKWRTAAANAITILVRAGVKFNGSDLRGIQIPGADLSYGAFDSAHLEDADLRKANLRGIWMRQTDLSRTQMAGVQFGELPFLNENNEVWSCAYSPDGRTFAVGLGGGDVSVYTTSSWERKSTLNHDCDGGSVRRVVYSPQSDRMATCGDDNTVKLWNAETRECLHILHEHTDLVTCVSYSSQGDRIASSSSDSTVRIWDVVTGECLQTLSGHSDEVFGVAYSPQGDQIASGGADCVIRLWDIDSESCSYLLLGHADSIWNVTYSSKGDQLATSGMDSTIRLWDAGTGDCRHILTGHSASVLGVAFSPKGDQLASTGLDTTVRLWDLDSGICRQTMTGHTSIITTVIYSPTGDQIASGSHDMTVRLWDASTGASFFVPSGHSAGITSLRCSPDGNLFVSGSLDGTARLWSAETGECRQTLDHGYAVVCVAYGPREDQIVFGSSDHSVRLWDLATGTCQHTLTGHDDWVLGVAYSPEGTTIASASQDSTVRLWDIATGACRRTLEGHEAEVKSAVFSPDGEYVATSSADGTIRLWSVVDGECIKVLEGHEGWASIAYSSTGNQLASGSSDTTVRLWDVELGVSHLIMIGHGAEVHDVVYSPKGDLLASGSEDKTLRLWSVASGQCLFKQGFQDAIQSIGWSNSPDTINLVTGCGDGSVLKWEIVIEGKEYRAHLCWSVTNGLLAVTDASMQDVRGLSRLNKQLLKQRGAVGEPENLLHGTSKKVAVMASVVSKLKQPSSRAVKDSSANTTSLWGEIMGARAARRVGSTRAFGNKRNDQDE